MGKTEHKIKVAYSNRTRYWQIYAFSNPPTNTKYIRGLDIPFHLLGIKSNIVKNTKVFFPFRKADLYHTYNGIVANSKPWVIEIESLIPRFGSISKDSIYYKWGARTLKSNYCKHLIFTSKYSRDLNKEFLKKNKIPNKKISVIYRAVESWPDLSGYKDNAPILFAGNAFYRKGGLLLLKAFNRIKNKHLRLKIISNFEVDYGIYPKLNDIQNAKDLIRQDDRISVCSNISHSQLIKEIQLARFFVAPTFADPFNNTVLEAIGCGKPVIAADTGAITEIISNNNGAILPFSAMPSESEKIEALHQKLLEWIQNSELLKSKGKEATKTAESRFSIEKRNTGLEKIYRKALDR